MMQMQQVFCTKFNLFNIAQEMCLIFSVYNKISQLQDLKLKLLGTTQWSGRNAAIKMLRYHSDIAHRSNLL